MFTIREAALGVLGPTVDDLNLREACLPSKVGSITHADHNIWLDIGVR